VFGRKEKTNSETGICLIGTVQEKYWATDRSRDVGSGIYARRMEELIKIENLRYLV
jgi:hypothetical protein